MHCRRGVAKEWLYIHDQLMESSGRKRSPAGHWPASGAWLWGSAATC